MRTVVSDLLLPMCILVLVAVLVAVGVSKSATYIQCTPAMAFALRPGDRVYVDGMSRGTVVRVVSGESDGAARVIVRIRDGNGSYAEVSFFSTEIQVRQ